MFCQIFKRFHRLVICLVVTQIYAPLMVHAAISDLPPLLKSNVPPNIVFTLDDSGSMQWEAVPDAMTRSVDSGYGYSGFPLPVSIYKSGSLDYPDVTSFNDTDVKNARYRSSTTNTLYYNPATRYSPWIDSSGVSMTPAVATSAKFNPVLATGVISLAVIDLTNTATYCARWVGTASSGGNVSNPTVSGGCTSGTKRSFYPATYYQYDATLATACDTTKLACFKKVEIRSTTATYPTSSQRTDCVLPDGRPATSCSYVQEIQNFANWFQFWRSRILVARGGVGSAFAKQGTAIRVGYGAINDSGTIKSGVKNDFAGTNRSSFFDYLYTHPMPGSGTPLRTAIDNVGQYFVTQTGASGPWQNTIGDSSSGQATCRQNFHILMTDGYWNGGGAASSRQGDYDSISGSVMTRPDGTTYQYIKAKPYSDDATVTVSGAKGTLADIAMYYWVTDLRSDWATKEKKNVPTTAKDPAFWQHLVHFTVGLGVKSVIDIHNPADLASLSTGTNWPTPGDTSPNNVDDLAHAALNSRGDFFSAGNPNEFANALDNALNEIAARTGSAAAVGTSSKSVGSGVKLYTSTYETTNWSGRLEQKTIDSTTGAITGSDWNSDSSIPATRNIFTSNATGSGGIIFDYSNLTVSDKAVFTTAKANTTVYPPALGVTEAMMVTYLSGDQTNTRSSAADTSKPFRIRPKLLGDLVNSDPLYVREGVDGHYSFLPASTPGKESYQGFFEANKARQPMLYVGANDGMLHAFNMSTSGSTAGKEVFAYVPKAVIPNLPALADPDYKHQFYVDGSPQVGDAYIGGGWKTILLGTTGAGGKSIFALDITDPATFGVTKVLWEKNVNTNVAPLASPDVNLGFTIGNPQMGRMKDGRWVVIYGNGYESTSYRAVLYVVDLATGSLISSIDTGVGSALAKNGLGTPKLLIGPDATIKAAYAGDLQGNLWKFDFSSPLTGTTVPKLAFTTTPLFTAVSSSKVQPITTQPQLFAHPNGGYIVMFGTGKIFEDGDPVVKDTQTVYGIWDKSDIPLVTPDAIVGGKLKLQQQKLTLSGTSFYKVENNNVDWTTKRGWYVDLDIKLGERVITDPLVMNDLLMVTTLIPGSSTDPCLNDGLSTILFLSPFNGGPVGYQTIDTDGNGTIDASDTFVSGRQVSSTFGNTVLRTGGGKGVSYTAPGDSGAATGTAGGVKCTTGVCVGDLSRGDPVPTVRLWRQILGRE